MEGGEVQSEEDVPMRLRELLREGGGSSSSLRGDRKLARTTFADRSGCDPSGWRLVQGGSNQWEQTLDQPGLFNGSHARAWEESGRVPPSQMDGILGCLRDAGDERVNANDLDGYPECVTSPCAAAR